MLVFFRRLALGLFLILAASAILLYSDLGSRAKPAAAAREVTAPSAPRPRVAILQHASQMVLDDLRHGMLAGMAERGWQHGRDFDLAFFNAEGDMPVAQTIAQRMASGGYNLLLTISTPSLQAVASANRAGRTPHLFAGVTLPSAAGVGISDTDPMDHPPHLAGYGTLQPVARSFEIAKRLNPNLKAVGTLYNAAESNAEAQMALARETARRLGINLLETTVENSAGVSEAANALVARGAEALWVCGDTTVLSAVDTVIAAGRKGRVPVFTVIPPNAKKGGLFDVGANYTEVGRLVGLLAGEVLSGTKTPADIPVENVVPETLVFNLRALAGLRPGWSIPPDLLESAALVIDENGVERHAPGSAAAQPASSASSAPPPPPRPSAPLPPKKIGLAYYTPEPGWQECADAFIDELRLSGYVEGQNLTIVRTHASGEIVNIAPKLQNLAHSDVDVIVPFTTPVIQGALATVRTKPMVFTYCTDPIAAGVGRSWTDHDPRITGVGTSIPVAAGVDVIRRAFPSLRRLGVLYNAAEANSVSTIQKLRPIAAEAGIQLHEITLATPGEAIQAAQALVTRRVEAVYIAGDNTALQSMSAIAGTLTRARVPLIIADPAYIDSGALFAVGPGYGPPGRAAARMLLRVFAGESPASIPMEDVSVRVVTFNPKAAAALGLQLDPALIAELTAPEPAAATPPPLPPKKIAFAYYTPEPSWQDCADGLLDELRLAGYVEGRNLTVLRAHASGETVNIVPMLQNFAHSDVDVIVPFSTPVIQASLGVVRTKPIVFTYCTDPIAAGIGRSWTDHDPRITGVGTSIPVAAGVDVIRRAFPAARRVGVLYNAGEANSVSTIRKLRAAAGEAGLQLTELTIATPGEAVQAVQALVTRRVELVYIADDNTALQAIDAIAGTLTKARIPLVLADPAYLDVGAVFAVGPGYGPSGRAAARKLLRVFAGESPAGIPMEDVSIRQVAFNPKAAAALGLNFPPALIAELTAEPGSAAAQPAPASTPAPSRIFSAPPAAPKRIALILYNENAPADETLEGMKAGWARSPLVAGRDYVLSLRSAQGDIATLGAIYDAALTDRTDIFVPISTPSLQAAIRRVKDRPIVFTMVANPIAAGAGKSFTDHLPHVTGVSVLAPVDEMLDLLARHYPQIRRIGTLFCPAETNSVDVKDALSAACRARGIHLETVAVNTATELPDAAASLAGRRIDAIVQVSDNLTTAGFTSITQAARRARKPLFSLNSSTVPLGAPIAIGRDYHAVGEQTVRMIERVLAGASPADIPFLLPPTVKLTVSPAHARAVGMELPPALLAEAKVAE